GLRRGLISDCSIEVPTLWSRTLIASYIEEPIFSCSAGLKKPDPRIYQLACDRLRVEPSQCLYVGDGSSQELRGATDAGMDAVLIAPPDEPPEPQSERLTWQGKRIEALSQIISIVESRECE